MLPVGISRIRLAGLAVKRVPAEPEGRADAVRLGRACRAVTAEKTGVRIEVFHGGHGIERFGITAAMLVAGRRQRVPFHEEPEVYRPEEFAKRLAAKNHFLCSVLDREKLFVVGKPNDLARTAGRKTG